MLVKRYNDMTPLEQAFWTLRRGCEAAHGGGYCSSPKPPGYLDENEKKALTLLETTISELQAENARLKAMLTV